MPPSAAAAIEMRSRSHTDEDGEFVAVHEDITKMRAIDYIPYANMIYDMAFDDPPTLEQIKETLNLLGLVSALVLTMVAPLPYGYSYDDYNAAITRMGGDVNEAWDATPENQAGKGPNLGGRWGVPACGG